jgi:hypothetical protein
MIAALWLAFYLGILALSGLGGLRTIVAALGLALCCSSQPTGASELTDALIAHA